MRAMLILGLLVPGVWGADDNIERTIKDLYASTQAQLRTVRTRKDLDQVLSTFAPEWVGTAPAGETLTLADLVREGESALSVPPDKRPIPQQQFAYIHQTGWNVLAVYWNYRKIGTRVIGSLYRDTWVQTPAGWRRIRQEKFFPDRPLSEDGKAVILPQ
jgi:hypothetical protein